MEKQLTNLWRKTSAAVCVVVIFAAAASTAHAQHRFTRGDNAPGVAGQNALMAKPSLNGYLQPVRIIVPEGALVGMYTGQEDAIAQSEISVGLMVGHPYRVRVTDIPRRTGEEIYPSIELLDRLHPPAGLEADFPVHVVLTQDDLEQAIRGKMVTKVVYVENPRTALPFQQQLRDDAPYVEVNAATEPISVAEQLGRPIAIVRLGSRVPVAEEAGSPYFSFMAPVTQPLNSPLQVQPDAQFYEQFNDFQNRMNDSTALPQGAMLVPPLRFPERGNSSVMSSGAPRTAHLTDDFRQIPAPVAPAPPVFQNTGQLPSFGDTIRR
ncbi:MAG: hypothetical protein AAF456_12095 [Planctomycetota bacterium]